MQQGAELPCMYVKSFQIKGRDQRVVFAGVLDYTTITLSRLGIILKEFTHVTPRPGNPFAVLLRLF